MKPLIDRIKECSSYRDLYHLSEELLENGIVLTATANGTKVLCAIREGRLVMGKIFRDFIFVDGKNNDSIDQISSEIIQRFVSENISKERLSDNTPSYLKMTSLYGVPRVAEAKLLGEQKIRYISRFIQD